MEEQKQNLPQAPVLKPDPAPVCNQPSPVDEVDTRGHMDEMIKKMETELRETKERYDRIRKDMAAVALARDQGERIDKLRERAANLLFTQIDGILTTEKLSEFREPTKVLGEIENKIGRLESSVKRIVRKATLVSADETTTASSSSSSVVGQKRKASSEDSPVETDDESDGGGSFYLPNVHKKKRHKKKDKKDINFFIPGVDWDEYSLFFQTLVAAPSKIVPNDARLVVARICRFFYVEDARDLVPDTRAAREKLAWEYLKRAQLKTRTTQIQQEVVRKIESVDVVALTLFFERVRARRAQVSLQDGVIQDEKWFGDGQFHEIEACSYTTGNGYFLRALVDKMGMSLPKHRAAVASAKKLNAKLAAASP